MELPRPGGHHWFVVECICGWSSQLYSNAGLANEAYAKHKVEREALNRQPLPEKATEVPG